MTTEENKGIVARCWWACFAGDLAVADELVAVDSSSTSSAQTSCCSIRSDHDQNNLRV